MLNLKASIVKKDQADAAEELKTLEQKLEEDTAKLEDIKKSLATTFWERVIPEGKAAFMRGLHWLLDSAMNMAGFSGGKGSAGGGFYPLSVSDISVDTATNSLTITYMDGTTANFSKATTLDITESSGTYTIMAKQGNVVVAGPEYIQAGGSYGDDDLKIGSISWSRSYSSDEYYASNISHYVQNNNSGYVHFEVYLSDNSAARKFYIAL
jgi:hypothetical protein